jgi:hypothetical protein
VSKATQNKSNQNNHEKMEWRRADLHLHTPGSRDYQESGVSYLDILKKAAEENLAFIAFTDHNTIAGYAAMVQEISDLERWVANGRAQPQEIERLQEYRRLREKVLVLPGFELTATLGFHVLGVFDPGTPIRSIEHVLLRLNVPPALLDVGDTEVGATTDVITAYRIMAEAGALVIAAHANSSHGVAMFGFDFGGQTKIAYTQDPNLHALEVTDLESSKRRTTASFFSGSKPEYARRMHCIQGSDAHRLHGLPGSHQNLGIGDRSTELLLPEVSFQALKTLFMSNDFARTRPCTPSAEAPFDYVQDARKQGASIVQSFHDVSSRAGGRLHAILRDVVAFANTNGGTIWIGVSPNAKLAITGIDKPQVAIDELRSEIEHLITPPIEVVFNVMVSGGKNVIQLQVPKGDQQPYVLEGSKIFLRQETETSLAIRDEIISLIRRVQNLPPEPQAAVIELAAVESPVASSEPEVSAAAITTASESPRTGVEISSSQERKGQVFHSMRDLRDGNIVHNVSRASARRLWRYAIALKEKHIFDVSNVAWNGDLGLWHKYLRNGKAQYDLVQRTADGEIHIYYGVTEDGIYGPWKSLLDRTSSTAASEVS